LKIVIHDYAGHPFQVDLSRNLSKKGYIVYHLYFAGDKGPKGDFKVKDGDRDLFFEAIGSDDDYSKTNFLKRRSGDLKYGKSVSERILDIKPDILISGNTPTETQEIILKTCKSLNCKFFYWCQDFYSIAATSILRKKIPFVGGLIGKYYQFLECRQMHRSNHIIHITDRFCKQTDEWGIDSSKVTVIPNWGALNEINVLPKDANWQKNNGLDQNSLRVLYSGTLALKHNPRLIEVVARNNPNIEVIVVASGVGVNYLQKFNEEIPNLKILPLQPFSVFSKVLSSADILIGVIEKDAGEFSVPSKVLSYLCAGRPIVLAAPLNNLASEMINKSKAGVVVDSNDELGFSNAISELMKSDEERKYMGLRARKYAEENFDIEKVTDSFIKIIEKNI
jgi:colanic acid biosynthesis glycosyl transferase WcaI